MHSTRKARWKIWLQRTSLIVVLATLALFVALGLYVKKITEDLPDVSTLSDYKPSLITRIFNENNEVISEYYHEKRVLVSLDQVPTHLIDAILAIEDTSYFKHYGINITANIRATVLNIKAGRIVQGASTLTQQLTKLLFVGSEKTYTRKIKEAFLALKQERLYSKEEILELYCNQIYFGNGAYGVFSTANQYFGKSLAELTLAECATIAGLIQRPNGYNPFRYPERAITRRNIVLQRMAAVGFISWEEAEAARNEDLVLRTTKDLRIDSAPYFNEYVRRTLEEKYGQSAVYNKGFNVYTTLSTKLQRLAEKALKTRA